MMAQLSGAIYALLFVAGPALSATMFTGTFDANGEGRGDLALSGYPNSTSFNFFFVTTAPIIQGTGQYNYETAFDDYFDGSSTPFGGDNTPTSKVFKISKSLSKSILITPRGYNLYYPDGNLMERDYFYADDVSVDVFVPTRYANSGFTFGISPVADIPEPTTWAMMAMGFGAFGATLRSYRRPRNTA